MSMLNPNESVNMLESEILEQKLSLYEQSNLKLRLGIICNYTAEEAEVINH